MNTVWDPESGLHSKTSLYSVLHWFQGYFRMYTWILAIIRTPICLRIPQAQGKIREMKFVQNSYSQWLVVSENFSLSTQSFLWTKLYSSILRNHTEPIKGINSIVKYPVLMSTSLEALSLLQSFSTSMFCRLLLGCFILITPLHCEPLNAKTTSSFLLLYCQVYLRHWIKECK